MYAGSWQHDGGLGQKAEAHTGIFKLEVHNISLHHKPRRPTSNIPGFIL